MGITKKEEREYARMLFVNERLTYKDIAARVKVTEKTIGKWAVDDGWDKLRKSLLTTRQNQLVYWYNQLDAINDTIEKRDNVPTFEETSIMSKTTANIQRLEIETSIGEYIEVGKKVLVFIQDVNLNDAKLFKNYFDEFINSQLKK
ncbi:hypothetical protein [Flavobacterium sp. '19STA2R22 D10 B1']|uniref:hypothetical protein n=1 Tax=Flavobacterium aerium TaxID=3037261 RepID=UPI00278C1A2B|nr:hypothetical protein [Flavobacterium sp. '19STA2R22 D10 B1']